MAATKFGAVFPDPNLHQPPSQQDLLRIEQPCHGHNAYALQKVSGALFNPVPVDEEHLATPGLAAVSWACLLCFGFSMLLLGELDGQVQHIAVLGPAIFCPVCATFAVALVRWRLFRNKQRLICAILMLNVNACFTLAATAWPDEKQRACHFAFISLLFKICAISAAEWQRPTSLCYRTAMMSHVVVIGSLVIDALVVFDDTLSPSIHLIWAAAAAILAEISILHFGNIWMSLKRGAVDWNIVVRAISSCSDTIIRVSSDGHVIENWDDRFQALIEADAETAQFSFHEWFHSSSRSHSGQADPEMTEAFELAAKHQIAELRCVLKDQGMVDLCILQAPMARGNEGHFIVSIRCIHDTKPKQSESPCLSVSEKSISESIASSPLWERSKGSPSEVIELGVKERWLIDPSKLLANRDDVLGIGGFGEVIGGMYFGMRVAIKIPKTQVQVQMPLLNELRMLRHVRHPNIVLYLGACIIPKSFDMALVFEFVNGVTLTQFLKRKTREADRMIVVHSLASAVAYLHDQDQPIVHGDIKGDNIFVESSNIGFNAKLGDFGVAKRLTKTPKLLGGTVRWTAPELIKDRQLPAAPTADIYSFGCILSFIVSGKLPFHLYMHEEISKMIIEGETPKLEWRMETPFEQSVSLVGEQSCNIDPLERPAMPAVVKFLMALPRCEHLRGALSTEPLTWEGDVGDARILKSNTDSEELPKNMCTLGALLQPSVLRDR